jgi:hypothetical protein
VSVNPPKEVIVRVSSPVAPGAGKVTCCVAGVTVMPAALLTTVSMDEVEDNVYKSPGQNAVMLWLPADSVGLKVAVAVVVLVEETARAGLTLPMMDFPSNNCMFGVYSPTGTLSTPETVADSVMLVVLAVKAGPLSAVVVGSAATEIVKGVVTAA